MNNFLYNHVIDNSQFFDDIKQIESFEKSRQSGIEPSYFLVAIQNTIKNGYVLSKKEDKGAGECYPVSEYAKDIEMYKKVATTFFYWWWNQPGSNTMQGFDQWMKTDEAKEIFESKPLKP